MPTYIYPSEKVLPYVYFGIHKITGQFYFGSRTAIQNYISKKRPSHVDFGTYYFTSSEKIKELGFENFDWVILAEFFSTEDALNFEDLCIDEFWLHPLSLNFQKGGKKFNQTGKNSLHRKTEEEKNNIRHKQSISLKGIKRSEETKRKMSKPKSKETIEKMSKPKTEETRFKMKQPKPKVICPHCQKEGGKPQMIRYHFDNCKFKKVS